MQLSYSSYKNDIISFKSEEYIKNLDDVFYSFINIYKDIENEDFKKPIFSQTSKFKKIPNNFKNYKYLKINRDNEEEKNNWVFENPVGESEKISILIKTYLNKISEDTYKKISIDFINEILLIDNPQLFEILSKEILCKCLFDNKYRKLYINLCNKIWTNKQIHYNLVEIIDRNGSFYWKLKSDKAELEGPFSSNTNAKNDIYSKLNFKKYFINHIQLLYKSNDISFENLTEDECFLKKKKILLLVELIAILFLEKYIVFDIINIIIIDLLHLNGNNFKNIEEIEFESLYTLIKLIKESKTSYNDLVEYKVIFNEYIVIIQQIITNVTLTKRSSFFLNDIVMMLNSLTNQQNKVKTVNNDIIFFEQLKNNNLGESINIYKNIDKVNKPNIITKCIEMFMDQKKVNNTIIKLLIDINDSNLIFVILEKISVNISDIMLDIPDADKKILYLIDNIKYDHVLKDDIIKLLKECNYSEDDSEDDTEDDSENDSEDDSEDDTEKEDIKDIITENALEGSSEEDSEEDSEGASEEYSEEDSEED